MFLQAANSMAGDWPIILGIVVVITGLILYYLKVKKDQAKLNAAEHNAYSHTVNDSNYNINREGVDGHRDKDLSKKEAERAVETLKETNEIPSQAEFNEIKKDLKS